MNTDFILKGNLFKVWNKFIFASVVGVVLNAIYTIVDGIFVGQGSGETGLAGVNLAWPAVTVILGLGLMLGIGASSLIAIALGQKDFEQAEKILGTVLKSSLLLGTALMLIGFLLSKPITSLLGATPDTFKHTHDYFFVIYLMAIPYLLANTLGPLVRASGNPKLSMLMIAVGAIGNIILDWFFVIYLKGGTGGAALATGAGVILSSVIGIYYFTLGKSPIKLRRHYFCLDKVFLMRIIKIGFVSLMVQLSIGIVILIQNKIIYHYGNTTDIAIFSVAGYIISLYTQLCVGISQGMQPLIGYHLGADKIKRMHLILWMTIGLSFLSGIIALSFLILYGRSFISFFGMTEAILSLAYRRTLIFCIGAPFIGIVYTVSAYYQSINRNIAANILSITRGFILQAGFSLLLPSFIGVEGIFYAQCLSDFLGIFMIFIIMAFTYMNRKIKRRKIISVD